MSSMGSSTMSKPQAVHSLDQSRRVHAHRWADPERLRRAAGAAIADAGTLVDLGPRRMRLVQEHAGVAADLLVDGIRLHPHLLDRSGGEEVEADLEIVREARMEAADQRGVVPPGTRRVRARSEERHT